MSSYKRAGGPPGGGDGSKRPRNQDEDEEDMVDDMIDEEEEMMAEEAMQGHMEEEAEVTLLGTKDVKQLKEKWGRPAPQQFDPKLDTISFQQIETDYTVAPTVSELAMGNTEPRAAVVRMFGVTKEGNSVVAHVHGFMPYFYVRAPPNMQPQDIPGFQATLNAKVKAGLNAKDQCNAPIVNVNMVSRQSIMNYAFGQPAPFLRIITALPSLVATCRRLLEGGMQVPNVGSYSFETFESNCAYALRCVLRGWLRWVRWLW